MSFFIRKQLLGLCIAIALLSITATAYVISKQESSDALSPIEKVTDSFESSKGNLYGNIYSLDGESMLQCLNLSTGENVDGLRSDKTEDILYCATQPWYAPVVGYNSNSESFGMLAESEIKDILQSNARYSNMRSVQGDSIITTIVSTAQEEAVTQLEEYSGEENGGNGLGSIAVVNADGAILVNASSVSGNEKFQDDNTTYQGITSDEPLYYICNDNAYSSAAIGSSFKPLTARIIEQNDDILSDEWSVYNETFDDVSEVVIDGIATSNWEINMSVDPSAYYTTFDGSVYHRDSNLAQAFINSSNTYFLRHANALGLNEYKKCLNNILHLYSSYNLGSCTLDGMRNFSEDRFESEESYLMCLPYGQSAVISPVRLASAYNYALGGKFYIPFEIAQIRDPDDNILYQCQPMEREEYETIDINVEDDIVVDGLRQTFLSYMSSSNTELPSNLLSSGRLLAKSGTAVVDSTHDNRTMALTLLNRDKTEVVCTAVIAVDGAAANTISNETLIIKLLKVLDKLEVLR